MSELSITPEDRAKHAATFSALKPVDGFISGQIAKSIFLKSRLDNETLLKIWNLSDVDSDGRMDEGEFVLAMFLITLKMKGGEVPDVLPDSLNPHAELPLPPLTDELYQKYGEMFQAIDRANTGFLTSKQAYAILSKAQLPSQTLMNIWNLSDMDKDDKLNLIEFVLAMHLTTLAKSGYVIPAILPAHLTPASEENSDAPPEVDGEPPGDEPPAVPEDDLPAEENEGKNVEYPPEEEASPVNEDEHGDFEGDISVGPNEEERRQHELYQQQYELEQQRLQEEEAVPQTNGDVHEQVDVVTTSEHHHEHRRDSLEEYEAHHPELVHKHAHTHDQTLETHAEMLAEAMGEKVFNDLQSVDSSDPFAEGQQGEDDAPPDDAPPPVPDDDLPDEEPEPTPAVNVVEATSDLSPAKHTPLSDDVSPFKRQGSILRSPGSPPKLRRDVSFPAASSELVHVGQTYSAEDYDRTNEDYDPVRNEIELEIEEQQEKFKQQTDQFQKEMEALRDEEAKRPFTHPFPPDSISDDAEDDDRAYQEYKRLREQAQKELTLLRESSTDDFYADEPTHVDDLGQYASNFNRGNSDPSLPREPELEISSPTFESPVKTSLPDTHIEEKSLVGHTIVSTTTTTTSEVVASSPVREISSPTRESPSPSREEASPSPTRGSALFQRLSSENLSDETREMLRKQSQESLVQQESTLAALDAEDEARMERLEKKRREREERRKKRMDRRLSSDEFSMEGDEVEYEAEKKRLEQETLQKAEEELRQKLERELREKSEQQMREQLEQARAISEREAKERALLEQAERDARERAERAEKAEREARELAEKERLERDRIAQEAQLALEREIAEMKAKEEAERIRREAEDKLNAERELNAEKEAQERIERAEREARERLEKDAKEREERAARAEAEARERVEKAEREAKERAQEAERAARERIELEIRLKSEQAERDAKERTERAEREARERVERENNERSLRLAQQQLEDSSSSVLRQESRERLERETVERVERETRERIEREVRERIEREVKEKIERETKDRLERERKLQELSAGSTTQVSSSESAPMFTFKPTNPMSDADKARNEIRSMTRRLSSSNLEGTPVTTVEKKSEVTSSPTTATPTTTVTTTTSPGFERNKSDSNMADSRRFTFSARNVERAPSRGSVFDRQSSGDKLAGALDKTPEQIAIERRQSEDRLKKLDEEKERELKMAEDDARRREQLKREHEQKIIDEKNRLEKEKKKAEEAEKLRKLIEKQQMEENLRTTLHRRESTGEWKPSSEVVGVDPSLIITAKDRAKLFEAGETVSSDSPVVVRRASRAALIQKEEEERLKRIAAEAEAQREKELQMNLLKQDSDRRSRDEEARLRQAQIADEEARMRTRSVSERLKKFGEAVDLSVKQAGFVKQAPQQSETHRSPHHAPRSHHEAAPKTQPTPAPTPVQTQTQTQTQTQAPPKSTGFSAPLPKTNQTVIEVKNPFGGGKKTTVIATTQVASTTPAPTKTSTPFQTHVSAPSPTPTPAPTATPTPTVSVNTSANNNKSASPSVSVNKFGNLVSSNPTLAHPKMSTPATTTSPAPTEQPAANNPFGKRVASKPVPLVVTPTPAQPELKNPFARRNSGAGITVTAPVSQPSQPSVKPSAPIPDPEPRNRLNTAPPAFRTGVKTTTPAPVSTSPAKPTTSSTTTTTAPPPQTKKAGNCCEVCGQNVFAMEALTADGLLFHKWCFRCQECNKRLSTGGYAAIAGKYYCKPHFSQLFKLKGNYDEGFGSAQRKHDFVSN